MKQPDAEQNKPDPDSDYFFKRAIEAYLEAFRRDDIAILEKRIVALEEHIQLLYKKLEIDMDNKTNQE